LNSPYHASLDAPLVLFHGDPGERGVNDLIETEGGPSPESLFPRRSLEALAAGMPFLLERFPSHKGFSGTSAAGLLGDRGSRMRKAQASTLASTVFFNREGRYVPMALPAEAQWAPAFAVKVADLDGDGNEDIFLAQNFFATRPGLPRLDAGTGLWLRGMGGTNLVSVPVTESGLRVFGEQRGAAFADFDRDGRIDIVISQNGAATKLLRNQRARPGLRVRLAGPPGNADGIGAAIRLRFGERWGVWREVHGGSGYQSFDSAVEVLATPQAPSEVVVRWPGGRLTTVSVPAGSTEIMVGIK
jgi:hypothetical protein